MLNERDYQLPWKRGIGNESRKIWDANGRLVCTMETSADSTFLVEAINGNAALQKQYTELLYAVEQKHDGETRHETALRYIQEQERRDYGEAQEAGNEDETNPSNS